MLKLQLLIQNPHPVSGIQYPLIWDLVGIFGIKISIETNSYGNSELKITEGGSYFMDFLVIGLR